MKVRAERRVPGPARPVDVQRMRGMSGNASRVATAETDARTHGTHAPKSQAAARPSSPTIEELKARHETMRDPAQREKMRAEHRARMEERRQRMEERRRQYLERHAGEASSAAKNAVSSSDSK
ncbi:MAG: hypothetical protein MJ240_11435 [Kiritimatiellae bacterium]|nr:hypothetical protein [Kiritimatiellia bacterium]